MTWRPGGVVDAALVARAERWIADDPDPTTAAEAADLLRRAQEQSSAAAEAATELADRFSGLLTFGTAGLRGRLGAGPNRMNRAVVLRAAAALAGHVAAAISGGLDPRPRPRVVIGYDARHASATFARDTAAVVSAAGGLAFLLPRPLPTPVLAFAVRRLDADAGVMVTASHNPPGDSGYKVYLGGRVVRGPGRGAQLVPPADADIAARMADVPAARAVRRSARGWKVLDDEIVEAYVERVVTSPAFALRGPAVRPPRDVSGVAPPPETPGSGGDARRGRPRIVLTPLHGVGGEVAVRVLAQAGFDDVRLVPEQADPDPDFPTVPVPNPEEPGVLDLALAAARDCGADLVLALDPDADRCAGAIPDPRAAGGWRVLTGDEVGALLGERAARAVGGRPGAVFASSVVSSDLLGRIAAAHGVPLVRTLTGFKWIARVPGLAYGYEEALGYCVDPDAVRDKDGVAAALALARMLQDRRRLGSDLAASLDELAAAHGVHATAPVVLRVAERRRIADLMRGLRASPPQRLAGGAIVETIDYARAHGDLPPTDAVAFRTADGDRVVIRPSGTEPTLKCYVEVVVEVRGGDVNGARAVAAARLDRLRRAVAGLVGAPRD